MEQVLKELNNALRNMQAVTIEGNYNNLKNMTTAIECIMRAGDMIAAMKAPPKEGQPVQDIHNAPGILDVEHIGDEE